jgi:hypothetical protein
VVQAVESAQRDALADDTPKVRWEVAA